MGRRALQVVTAVLGRVPRIERQAAPVPCMWGAIPVKSTCWRGLRPRREMVR